MSLTFLSPSHMPVHALHTPSLSATLFSLLQLLAPNILFVFLSVSEKHKQNERPPVGTVEGRREERGGEESRRGRGKERRREERRRGKRRKEGRRAVPGSLVASQWLMDDLSLLRSSMFT